jgi:hypothetical protein
MEEICDESRDDEFGLIALDGNFKPQYWRASWAIFAPRCPLVKGLKNFTHW